MDRRPLHLTPRQIDAYARCQLPPGELLAVDDHLAACVECRLAVAERLDLAPALAAWEGLEDREGKLDGEASEVESAERALAETLLAPPGSLPRGRRWSRRLAWAAGLAFAAALAAWLLLGRTRGEREEAAAPPPPSQGEPSRPPPDRAATGGEIPAPPEGAQGAAPEGIATSGSEGGEVLADGERRLVLASPDRLAGLEGVPPAWGRLVRESWAVGKLATPRLLSDLRTGSEVLRGGSDARDFAPLDPVGRVVRGGAPAFRWSPLPGAESYRVRVYDLSFRVVAESPVLDAAGGEGRAAPPGSASREWTPAASLQRGAVYTWQISARRGGEETIAPEPARGEARFQVLPAAALREIESAEALRPPSRLLLAALYARAGLLPEAERELGRLAEENPGSAAVRRLQASLKAGS